MDEKMPLYATKEEAYAAPGEIYQHYKGGVYRIHLHDVEHSETGEAGVVQEHLWPHAHQFKWRPKSVFESVNDKGEDRFKLIKKA